MGDYLREAARALEALGFAEVEALVYCEVLRSPNSTGYRIAQAIGKAQANIYKAISNLAQKGAILIDNGDTRSCQAVPPSELLSRIKMNFDQRVDEAEKALASIETSAQADLVLQLRNEEQAYERAKLMIRNATEMLLFNAFPEPLAAVWDDLCGAAGRGVSVTGVVFPEPTRKDRRILSVRTSDTAEMIASMPGQIFTLVVDAREYLMALFRHGGGAVHHGVWSNSVFLSINQHAGLSGQILAHAHLTGQKVSRSRVAMLEQRPPGWREFVDTEAKRAST